MEHLDHMKQEARRELQAVRHMMETELKEALEAVRNTSIAQPSQQPSQQPGESVQNTEQSAISWSQQLTLPKLLQASIH